jgi:trigger factor
MIKSTLKKEPGSITFTITADEAFIAPYKTAVLKRLKKDLKVDGFRPGQAPDNIAMRQLGEDRVQAEVLQEVIGMAYANQMREHKDIETLASPEVEIKKFVPYTELEFSATAPLMPEIKFDYSKLKVKKPEIKIAAKQVDEAIDVLRKQMATRVATNKAIKKGDEVRFDFEGTRAGKPVEGASAQNHVLTVGEGSFIPGFEENLIGLKDKDEKSFDVTFPKDYHAKDLQGAKVTFKVKINSVYEVSTPKVDDDFAMRAGNKKTVKELREDIEKVLGEQEAERTRKDYENEILKTIMASAKFELPKALVDQQKHTLEHEVEENLKNSGLDKKKYLEIQKRTEADFDKELTDEAKKRIQGALILRDVIGKQKITVGETELEQEIVRMGELYKSDPKIQEELTHDHFREDLRNHLLTQKAMAYLTEQASK